MPLTVMLTTTTYSILMKYCEQIQDTFLPSRQVLAFINNSMSRPSSFTLYSLVAWQPQNRHRSELLEEQLKSIHLQIWLIVYEKHTLASVKNKVLLNRCHLFLNDPRTYVLGRVRNSARSDHGSGSYLHLSV